MAFDDILLEVGETGWYQRRVCFVAFLPLVFTAFEAMSSVFIFNIPAHRCAIPGYPDDQYAVTNASHSALLNRSVPMTQGKWSACHLYTDVTVDVISGNSSDVTGKDSAYTAMDNASYSDASETYQCHTWVYDRSTFESTVATDFSIVCDRSVYRSTSNMVAEMGPLTGTALTGLLADRFGRKIPFMLGSVFLVGFGFGIAFTTSMATLTMCRFFMGIGRSALFVNGLVLGMEIVGPSKRAAAGIYVEILWGVGMFILLGFAYLIRQWRYLEIAVSVPAVVLLFNWWLVPESPRWLASHGREQEAVEILKKIAASNGTRLPPEEDVRKRLLAPEKTASFMHVFQSRELVKRMLIVFSSMMACVVMYYAMAYNVTNMSGDIFVNYLMTCVLETAGLVSPVFVLDRCGRRAVMCGSMMIAGACCVACLVPALLDAPDWIILVLAVTGRFFICFAFHTFATLYVYGAELFPTVIRGSTMGAVCTASRIGGLISPYIADVGVLVGGRLQKALPFVVMGSPALLVGLLILWLPETKGTRLPENLGDVTDTHRQSFSLCCKAGLREEEDPKADRELRPSVAHA